MSQTASLMLLKLLSIWNSDFFFWGCFNWIAFTIGHFYMSL